MACMSHRISIVKRSNGKSCVASAAYRFGENIKNELTGITSYYASKKGEVTYKEVLLPANAPQEWKNVGTLMNEIEHGEKRGDAQLARSVFFALPRELTREQNIALVQELAQTSWVSKGMCAAVAIHDKADGNPHAHVLLTMREIDGDHFGKKCRAWNQWPLAKEWMQNYEDITNKHYERANRPERIVARSFEEQGINRIPTVHEGYYATVLKKQGLPSRQGEENDRIREQNRLREALEKELALVDAALQKEQAREQEAARQQEWQKGEAEQSMAEAKRTETQQLLDAQQEAAKRHHRKYTRPQEEQRPARLGKQEQPDFEKRWHERLALHRQQKQEQQPQREPAQPQQQGTSPPPEPQHHVPERKGFEERMREKIEQQRKHHERERHTRSREDDFGPQHGHP